ncbi:hypothetical protein KBY91_01100 [Streptomyces sp. RK23]|uniref:hypothetical protein n=1 Tax=unclassified Streptomyces TaxID=2593676 RepID=UPI001B35F789|nr:MULTISPECIES: hypothetical protein [unclassified Streptomyces]MBQ0962238.1 hypothetical protein [Streptomyces sp. RK74B]MBQ1002019.1 hypothetical protein [Streptomyces sp. RK23]
MSPLLPPVDPSVTAQLVAALTPRLRKRLDAGVAKLAGRPVARDGDIVRLAVDDETDLELHAPGGVVTTAEAIGCGCLLAPDCLHRAAAASAAPVAEMPDPVAGEPSLTKAPRTAPPTSVPVSTPPATAGSAADDAPAGAVDPAPESATPAQRTAAAALHDAAAAVLEAGADGAGAVLQAELLRAAHTARLAGLPRAAGRAVAVVTALRAARDADPAHRLGDLTTALRDVLLLAHRLPEVAGPELAGLRGRVRQPYTPDGSLRLYGLFAEPVLTSTGYGGTVTWTADAAGRLYTVPDVAPGGAARAAGSADRAVRIGDTSLTHRELSRAGLAVSGATVSPTGRLGAGAGVRAVRAPGASWRAEPLDRLWAVPVAEQIARALASDLDVPKAQDTGLARDTGDTGDTSDTSDGSTQPTAQDGRDGRDGRDLLFLDVTLIGTVREAAGECLLADCDGLTVRLAAAHDDPALPDRENLRLLALLAHGRGPGTRLRVVARLTPAPLPRAVLLAASHPTDPDTHVDLGLDRLRRADLPAEPTAGTSVGAGDARPAPTVQPATASDEAPVHLLRRRVHQAASGGRRVLAFPGSKESEAARLRRYGLGTAGALLTALHATAAERARDPFGRLLPADTGRFATAWLGAAVYTEEVDRALCAAAWGASSPGLASR